MAFDDKRSDIQMAVRSLDESNRLFAVEVDMENRSPEEIARDAVMQINALYDRLIKEQKNKDDQNIVLNISALVGKGICLSSLRPSSG